MLAMLHGLVFSAIGCTAPTVPMDACAYQQALTGWMLSQEHSINVKILLEWDFKIHNITNSHAHNKEHIMDLN
ncbi:hypothetical protein NXS19_003700 [Fusarium pseudograminearum]|nr:hypothetical protein NXS19_003700 [Fusarium pseudograminearum]